MALKVLNGSAVLSKDAPGKSKRSRLVHKLQGLVELAVLIHKEGEDRSKDLLCHEAVAGVGGHDKGRLNEPSH